MPLVGDVTCYFCGFVSGELVGESGLSLRSGEFRPSSGANQSSGANRPLRCARCGGPVFLDDIRYVRPRPATIIERERPGRPRRNRTRVPTEA